MTQEPVEFRIRLKEGVDGNSIKSELEQLADDLTVTVHDLKGRKRQLVIGSTSKSTYERVFGAELDYITKTIPNVNKGPYDVQEWNEFKPAQVPEAFADKIEYIGLEQKTYLTD